MSKKIVFIVLIACLLLTGVSFAEDGGLKPGGKDGKFQGGDSVIVEIVSGAARVYGSGAMYDFGRSDQPWYSIKDSITSVTVENGVTYVGEEAFFGCRNLKTVEIAGSVKSLGENAFNACTKIESLTLNEGLEVLGGHMFVGNSVLKGIKLPSTLKTIGAAAFFQCTALREVTIPKNVQVIDGSAFQECTALNKVTFEENSRAALGALVFADCSMLKSVELVKGVTFAGQSTFRNCCSLKTIDLPTTVQRLYTYEFSGCTSLKNVTLPATLDEIGAAAFESTAIEKIFIPANVKNVSYSAFRNCHALTEVTVEKGSQAEVGFDDVFENCYNLEHICAVDGGFAGKKFLDCGEYSIYSEKKDVIVPATCTSDGSTRVICEVCGRVIEESDPVAAFGHEWNEGEITTEPTCLNEGVMTYSCAREGCGETYTEKIDALGHDFVKDEENSKEPTCKEAGEYVMACTRCAEKKTVPISKLNVHTYDGGRVTKEPTYENDGEMTYTCTVCGFTRQEPIEKLEPTPEPTATPAPTPTPEPTPEPTPKPIIIEEIDIKCDAALIMRKSSDNTMRLESVITPENADIKSMVWSVSDTTVASIDQNGLLTALKKGSVKVTLKVTGLGGEKLTASSTVNIKKNTKKIKKISFADKKITIKAGRTAAPDYTFKPANSYYDVLKWKSSNKKIATVDKNGVITAKKKGSCVITVKTSNGKKATLKIKVK